MRKIAAFLCVCILLQLCACEGVEKHKESSTGSAETTAARETETAGDIVTDTALLIDNDIATVTLDNIRSIGDGLYSFVVTTSNNTGLTVYYTAWYYVCGCTLASSVWVMEEGESFSDELQVDLHEFAGGQLKGLDEITVNYSFEYTEPGGTVTTRCIGSAYPTGLDGDLVSYPVRELADTDCVTVDDDDYLAAFTGIQDREDMQCPVFYIENRTDSYQTLTCKDFQVNDWFIGYDDMYPAEVSVQPHGTAYVTGIVYSDALARCGIDEIQKFSFVFEDKAEDTLITTHSVRCTVYTSGMTEERYEMPPHEIPDGAMTVYDNDALLLAIEDVQAADGAVVMNIYLEHRRDEECSISADNLTADGNGIELPYGLWSQTLESDGRMLTQIMLSDYDLAEYDLTVVILHSVSFDVIYDNYRDEIDTEPVTIDIRQA